MLLHSHKLRLDHFIASKGGNFVAGSLFLVGVGRFELPTPRPPDVYSNRTELYPEQVTNLEFLNSNLIKQDRYYLPIIKKFYLCHSPKVGNVAQLVEHRTENPGVGGSIPPVPTFLNHVLESLSAKKRYVGYFLRI